MKNLFVAEITPQERLEKLKECQANFDQMHYRMLKARRCAMESLNGWTQARKPHTKRPHQMKFNEALREYWTAAANLGRYLKAWEDAIK